MNRFLIVLLALCGVQVFAGEPDALGRHNLEQARRFNAERAEQRKDIGRLLGEVNKLRAELEMCRAPPTKASEARGGGDPPRSGASGH